MKALKLLLALTLISSFYSRNCEGLASRASHCNEADFNKTKYFKCCLFALEVSKPGQELKIKYCDPITKKQYNNITELMNEEIKKWQVKYNTDFTASIECNSNYLSASILFLILLLL